MGARYRLVVFDFDGTLADTFDWFCGELNGVADRYGFRRVAEDERETLRALGAREIVARLGVPLWKLPAIAAHMHALARRDVDRIRLFAGVIPMLLALREAGVGLALLSSNTEANVRHVLGSDAAALFERYACGASLFGKARRLATLVRASGAAPCDVLCIGDELRDAEAAREVGCAFGAVAWGYTRADALAALGPAHLFSTPEEVLAVVVPRTVSPAA